jgi:DNA-binding MarR family transcriptional regulator
MSSRRAVIAEFHENMATLQRQLIMRFENSPKKKLLPTRAQMGVLFLVSRVGTTGIKNIAERLCMTSSAATQLVDGLVDDGLLTRREGGEDRRKTEVSLTSKGKKKVDSCMKMRHKLLEKLLEPLTDAELRAFKNLQQKMLHAFVSHE